MSKSYWGEIKLMNDFGILAFLVAAQMWEEVGDAPHSNEASHRAYCGPGAPHHCLVR